MRTRRARAHHLRRAHRTASPVWQSRSVHTSGSSLSACWTHRSRRQSCVRVSTCSGSPNATRAHHARQHQAGLEGARVGLLSQVRCFGISIEPTWCCGGIATSRAPRPMKSAASWQRRRQSPVVSSITYSIRTQLPGEFAEVDNVPGDHRVVQNAQAANGTATNPIGAIIRVERCVSRPTESVPTCCAGTRVWWREALLWRGSWPWLVEGRCWRRERRPFGSGTAASSDRSLPMRRVRRSTLSCRTRRARARATTCARPSGRLC